MRFIDELFNSEETIYIHFDYPCSCGEIYFKPPQPQDRKGKLKGMVVIISFAVVEAR